MSDRLPFDAPEDSPHFDGETYTPEDDHIRLGGQILKVYEVVKDGAWRTLREISDASGAPESSVSARLRDLRKDKFGGHTVERRHRGEPANGLYEYRFAQNPQLELESPE
jgi:hypothetical protein